MTREEKREKERLYYQKTKSRRTELNRLRYKNNQKSFYKSNRQSIMKKKYGLTFADYEQMLISQNNSCLICLETSDKTLHVDHDHKTNKVRGLLCGPCNRALGLFKDDPNIIDRASDYLRHHGG